MTEPFNLEHSDVSLQPCMKAFTFEVTTTHPKGFKTHLVTVLCTCVYIGKETLLQANQGSPIESVRLHCVAEVVLQNNQTLMVDVQAKDLYENLTEEPTQGGTCATLEASDKQTGETNAT
jgi:hypothetical protein